MQDMIRGLRMHLVMVLLLLVKLLLAAEAAAGADAVAVREMLSTHQRTCYWKVLLRCSVAHHQAFGIHCTCRRAG
jgi:hypothetical protein